jgi:cysteinyl-tRNA synthetase
VILYDTLSGKSHQFTSSNRKVRIYVCGVTPYAQCHVGHAMSYVVFDVLRRYLEYCNHAIHHVQNFTDIDDKLILRAAKEETTVQELAERYINEYFQVMDRLNVQRAHDYPRATREIPQIVATIKSLIDKGYAYTANGDVYFRVTASPHYGKLSKRTLEGMAAGSRVKVAKHKENPMDFALWKGAKPGEPHWESPWGKGRPGWHIECSAMAVTYLGPTLDIHGGGQDLIFPHHENEIAQTEGHTGIKPFARFWMHNGLLQLGAEKMSKSVGNLVTVQEALSKHGSDGLRLFFLSSHYRNPLTYTENLVISSVRAMARLRDAANLISTGSGAAVDPEPYQSQFLQAMDDDLNTPQALAALFNLTRAINRGAKQGQSIEKAQSTLRELGNQVLGFTFEASSVEPLVAKPYIDLLVEIRNKLRTAKLGNQFIGFTLETPSVKPLVAKPYIDLLVEIRNKLRTAKDYEMADTIRNRLEELGVVLTDTSTECQWEFTRTIAEN